MSNQTPLQGVLERPAVETATVLQVSAPEWAATGQSAQTGQRTVRGVVAAFLVIVTGVLAGLLVFGALPGETQGVTDTTALTEIAKTMSSDAGTRLAQAESRQARADERLAAETRVWRKTRQAIRAARAEVRTAAPDDRPQARAALVDAVDQRRDTARARARARRAVVLAATAWAGAAEDRRAAMSTLRAAAAPRTTDADLIRVLTLAGLAVVALLGAVALVVPRARQPLTFHYGEREPGAVQNGGTTAGGPAEVSGAVAPSMPVAGKNDRPAGSQDSALRSVEPVWTQAVITAVALSAGVFGINNTSGLQESVLNVLVPVAPIIGAFFARRKVAALVNLSPQERARLPG